MTSSFNLQSNAEARAFLKQYGVQNVAAMKVAKVRECTDTLRTLYETPASSSPSDEKMIDQMSHNGLKALLVHWRDAYNVRAHISGNKTQLRERVIELMRSAYNDGAMPVKKTSSSKSNSSSPKRSYHSAKKRKGAKRTIHMRDEESEESCSEEGEEYENDDDMILEDDSVSVADQLRESVHGANASANANVGGRGRKDETENEWVESINIVIERFNQGRPLQALCRKCAPPS